jgi:ABC-2 type transport system ATP-binding protein
MATARSEALAILERLGISRASAFAPMEDMSRGMQQKVAIARAFLTKPALLLLDEPTTGLDPRSKKDVQAFVLELRERHGITVLLTTHDMDEADHLCDRIAILNRGRIIAADSPAALKAALAAQHGRAPTLEDVFMHHTGLEVDAVTGEVAEPVTAAQLQEAIR